MDILFIEGRYKEKTGLPVRSLAALPINLGLLTTVQHIGQLVAIEKQLTANGKQVITAKGKRTKYPCQVLGCDVLAAERIAGKVDAFLYIGTGMFHPKLVMINTDKPVFHFNPLTKEFRQLDRKDIEDIVRKRKASVAQFHASKSIGIIVSTKRGQYRMDDAIKLKNKLKHKDTYIFLAETVDFNDLENYTFIDCFVNTACPRIGYDDVVRTEKPIVNIEDVGSTKSEERSERRTANR